MPEAEDHIEMESAGTEGEALHDKSIIPMDVEGSDSQPVQKQGQAGDKVVIDLEEANEKDNARKQMEPRSDVWNHFIKMKDDKGILRHAKCKYCQRKLKAESKGNGTSALSRHLEICKSNPHKFIKDPKQGTLQATPGEGITTWRFDQDALREAFAEMIIEDELPFAFGEKSGFTKFMSKACPRFKLPSRRTCTRDTVRVYFHERAKLKKFFKDSCQRVSLTTDCWTSQQQDGYMTVTASFIDDNWQLHKKVISFFKIKGHKGEDIGKNLLKCMNEWGLDRVMTVTVDNASSNDSGVGILRRQLQQTNIADGKYLHMRCAAHIINLIVQDGLKEVDLSIKRVRAAIRYIKNGTSRLVKFKEFADEEKVDSKEFLKLDVPTRWNYTYLMLKAAIVYEKVFMKFAEDDYSYVIDLSEERDGPGHPDEDDWQKAKKMAEFLAHFHDLTVRVSSSLHVTCNTFFREIGEVHLLIQSWMNSEDHLQASMGKRMKDKFDKYWGVWHTKQEQELDNENDREKEKRGKGKGKGKEKEKENINLLIFVAAFLDPRYKLGLYTKLSIEEIFGEVRGQLVWEAITSCVRELFEEYRRIYAPSEVPTEASGPNQPSGGRKGMLEEKIAKRMKMETGSNNTAKSELDKYLGEDTEDRGKKLDILVWWKDNAARLPILARLARDVLAVPISTVASESAFSTSGRILDDFRTSLTPFMVEALVCAQDWLRRSTPIDIQENTEELEIMEKGNNIHSIPLCIDASLLVLSLIPYIIGIAELIEEFGNHKSTGKENPSTSKSQATTPSATTGSNSKSISKTRTSTC
jgi:hypothetical protein